VLPAAAQLLTLNRRIQKQNQAPPQFPGFVRAAFDIKILADGYVLDESGWAGWLAWGCMAALGSALGRREVLGPRRVCRVGVRSAAAEYWASGVREQADGRARPARSSSAAQQPRRLRPCQATRLQLCSPLSPLLVA
jgi:hypothetical protein